MSKTYGSFLTIFTLAFMAVALSGCYTIVGYPLAEVERGVAEGEPVGEPVYDYYHGYSEYPYSRYRDYYYPYYYAPYYSDYYWYYPWWHYDNYYYYRDRGDKYTPGKKPETGRRGITTFDRSDKPERGRSGVLEKDEEENKKDGATRYEQTPKRSIQRPARDRRESSTSSSEKGSTRKNSRDEDEK